MIGGKTRKGMRRKGVKSSGLRLAYDGLTKRKRRVARKSRGKTRKTKKTRRNVRRKVNRLGGNLTTYVRNSGCAHAIPVVTCSPSQHQRDRTEYESKSMWERAWQ